MELAWRWNRPHLLIGFYYEGFLGKPLPTLLRLVVTPHLRFCDRVPHDAGVCMELKMELKVSATRVVVVAR